MEKQERKEKKIMTENRLMTINKHETSFEGLASQLENGEDGIYNLKNENKNVIFQPKDPITKKDLAEIPFLQDLHDTILQWEEKLKIAKQQEGRDAFIIKKALIEMRKEQYIIKAAYRRPVIPKNKTPTGRAPLVLEDDYWFDDEGYIIPEGVSLCSPIVCSAILCNYSRLKEDSYEDVHSDLWALMLDFDDVSGRALKDFPLYEEIVLRKIDGMQNLDIQTTLKEKFGVTHSLEYISSLWRNKIPNLIASQAEDDLLDWYFLEVYKGKYKRCSRCGQIKLAHNKYFSKNKTSKDGYYSICKQCRNAKEEKLIEYGQKSSIPEDNK